MQGIYNIDKFFGGMSNDNYSGSSGMVFDAKNVDVSNTKGAILSRSYGLGDVIGYASGGYKQINTRGLSGILIGMVASGERYLVLSSDGRLVDQDGNSYDLTGIKSGIYYNISRTIATADYGFILAGNSILRWTFNSADSKLGIGTAGANITSHLTLSTGSFDQKSQILRSGNILYVSGGNILYAIDISTSTWTENILLRIETGYSITYITEIGDQIIIYANNGVHGKQYFWNGIDEAPDRVIDWYDKPILGGATLNNIDYVITGTSFKRELYMVNGYQPQILYETGVVISKEIEDKFFFSPIYSNSIETIGRTIIIPGVGQIYKYGNNKVGLPNGITRDRLFGSITSNDIGFLYYQEGNTPFLYVGQRATFDVADTNYLIKNSIGNEYYARTYSTTLPGTIKTLTFDNNNYSQKKQGLKYRIGYSLPKEGNFSTKINIYTRVDNQLGYADFYVYGSNLKTAYTTKPAIGDVYTFNSVNFTIYAITTKEQTTGTEIKDKGLILHTTYTSTLNSEDLNPNNQIGTLTKVSGVGDNTFKFLSMDFGFKLIQTIDGNDTIYRSKRNYTGMYTDYFNEIQFKFDLLTNEPYITPTIRDFKLLFNIIEDDLK